MKSFPRVFIAVGALGVLCAPTFAGAQNADLAAKVDNVISAATRSAPAAAPGCAVGVSRDGTIVERHPLPCML